MKVRFSDALLVSHRINKKQGVQKYTCCCSTWDVTFSPLRLVSLLAVKAFFS